MESELSSLESVHYVDYDTSNGSVLFHYENRNTPDKIENWLSTNGFLKDSVGMEDSDSLLIITPVLDCCR